MPWKRFHKYSTIAFILFLFTYHSILLQQEEMRKFIKFACNQERIPFGEPCRGMTDTVMNVPPYPMKIAPPDGTGNNNYTPRPYACDTYYNNHVTYLRPYSCGHVTL